MEKILKLDTILFSQSTIMLLHQDSKKPKDIFSFCLFLFPPETLTVLVEILPHWSITATFPLGYCYICNGSSHAKLFTLMYLLHFLQQHQRNVSDTWGSMISAIVYSLEIKVQL